MKKIFAVSIESKKKCCMGAVYVDDILSITHVNELSGSVENWKEKLLLEIHEKSEKDFACIIDDRTGSFSEYATRFSFDNIEEDGRTSLQHCFDWYFALENKGAIFFDTTVERFRINAHSEGSILDIKHDDKGRTLYHPNWNEIQGGHRAMLMAVYAATLEQQWSDRWINEYMKIGKAKKQTQGITSFHAITVGVCEKRQLDMEQAYWEKREKYLAYKK